MVNLKAEGMRPYSLILWLAWTSRVALQSIMCANLSDQFTAHGLTSAIFFHSVSPPPVISFLSDLSIAALSIPKNEKTLTLTLDLCE